MLACHATSPSRGNDRKNAVHDHQYHCTNQHNEIDMAPTPGPTTQPAHPPSPLHPLRPTTREQAYPFENINFFVWMTFMAKDF
jgi:hypothetical protein